MAQEDQTQKCSNSSSGNCSSVVGNLVRSSKRQKPKRVPQRGLGVAQLERIRLEEQQKKDAAIASTSVLPSQSSTLSATKPSTLSVPTSSYLLSNQPCSSSNIPFPPDLSSPNSMFRPSSSVQNIEILNSSTVPLTNPIGWSSVPVQGLGNNVYKLYNSSEYNFEKESSGLDPGLAFLSNLNALPSESIPSLPLPSMMKRAQQFQRPSSSTVYESSAISSSSVLNFQTEPPSNQSYYSNHPPMWPEEEKMIGMKRPYPFSLDQPPCLSSMHNKFLPSVNPRISRSEDSASCGSGHTLIYDPGNTISREGSSCPTFIIEPNNSKKSIRENAVINGGFLTLAPPTTTSVCQESKLKHPPHFLAFQNKGFPDFETLPYQGSVEDANLWPGPNERQPYYSFFPQSMAETGQATSTMNSCNSGEVGESVDLNLKL